MESTSKFKKFIASKLFTLLILLAAIVIFFAIASKGSFIKPINIKNILNAMVLLHTACDSGRYADHIG